MCEARVLCAIADLRAPLSTLSLVFTLLKLVTATGTTPTALQCSVCPQSLSLLVLQPCAAD